MFILSEPPHRIRLNSGINYKHVSVSPDYSQTFVFISTPTSINFYTANIVFELISQYVLTEDQTNEFGFIVDIKSSQSLPLLSVVTDKNYLLILTYEKDLVESFERLNSDGSLSTPKSTATFFVSGELHLLMAFSLEEMCTNTTSSNNDNIICKMGTLWDKNLLMIKTRTHLLALDFDKIASSKIKVASTDKSTDTLSLTINSRDVTVGEDQIGLVFVAAENPIDDNLYNSIGSYDNRIYYRDSLGRLVSIGHTGTIIMADNIGPFAVSSIIAYYSTFGTIKLVSKSKLDPLTELNLNGEVKMLSWCPKGTILAIVYKICTQNGTSTNDQNTTCTDYRLGLYGLYCGNSVTSAKIHFSEPLNISWSSLGLRLFLVTIDSLYSFDIFRPSGWYSGLSYDNGILIGPSAVLIESSLTSLTPLTTPLTQSFDTVNKCVNAEYNYLRFDYPLSTSSYWPFVIASTNPSISLLLIRSHNGALLLCSRDQRPVSVGDYYMGSKSNYTPIRRKPSIGENTTSAVYLNRHWRLLEFQNEVDTSQEYESFPCCWLTDSAFLSVGVSHTNILNNLMKVCNLSNETVNVEARLKIRRSPIIAKRIQHNTSNTSPFFYLLTRFDKVEVYNWLIGTDIIQIVVQVDLSFPNSIFDVDVSDNCSKNGEDNSPNSATRSCPSRQSSRARQVDYFQIKSIHIHSINILMESDNAFELIMGVGNVTVKIRLQNGDPVTGSVAPIGAEDNPSLANDRAKLDISSGALAAPSNALHNVRVLFDLSKRHFEKNGKLSALNLLQFKDRVPNGMLMRVCRMSLEYGTLDSSILDVFEMFVGCKDYLNASLVLICIQEIIGAGEMIQKYAKPLLIHSVKTLGHQPSLVHLIQQLIRIVETVIKDRDSATDDKARNSIDRDIVIAASSYLIHDFLGLLRVVLLLKLPLVDVVSSLKLEWRLSDCEAHFGTSGTTLAEMVSAIREQFCAACSDGGSWSPGADGWSVKSVLDLLLPIYHVSLEAGANVMAFAIALALGDRALAQLSVNGHIAGEIDKLDPECESCNNSKEIIAMVSS